MLKYLLLGDETSPAVVLLQDLAEPAVAHDHPVIQQEELPVDLVYIKMRQHRKTAAVVGGDDDDGTPSFSPFYNASH